MRSVGSVFVIALILLLTGLFYWALFVPKEEITQKIYQTLKEQEKRADLSFKRVTFEEISNGNKYWQLIANTAMVNKDQGIATLQTVEGTFYKNGRPSLKFRSPVAMWDMQKKEIYLDKPFGYDISIEKKALSIFRSVRNNPLSLFNLPQIYKQQPGYWFQAKNLSWKLADQRLVCGGGIVLNKGDVTGYAEKLSGDVALEKVALEGKPYLVIKPENSFPITVEAEAFEVLSSQDTFLAKGAPRIIWDTAVVTAAEAQYLQATQEIALKGDVKLDYNDIRAAGTSASYFTLNQQVVLSGEAWAQQGNNRLNGNKVMVMLREKKIQLLGKSRVVISEEELKK